MTGSPTDPVTPTGRFRGPHAHSVPVVLSATRRVSLAALILANLAPLGGVLFLGWDAAALLFLFWLENAVIGFYNLLKMASLGQAQALFFIPFFTIHYGAFLFGHLAFLVIFFVVGGLLPEGPGGLASGFRDAGATALSVLPMAGVFLLSHGVSFFLIFLREERRNATLPQLMMAPYGRVVVLHVAIVLGGFAAMFAGQPLFILVILVMGKIVLDVRAHLKEHGPQEIPASGARPPAEPAGAPPPPEASSPPGTPSWRRLP